MAKPLAERKAELYGHITEPRLDAWLEEKCREHPRLATNVRQKAFLAAVVARIKIEREEERNPEVRTQRYTETEPMLDLLHGLPG